MFSSIVRFFRYCNCFRKHDETDITNIPKVSKKKKGNCKGNCKVKKKQNDIINNNINNVVVGIDINDITYLENIEYKDTKPFIPPIKWVRVIKIYDGDTITVAARLPYDGSPIYRYSVRLAGIDAPEMKGGTANETGLATKSRDALHDLIFGKVIELRENGKEKYGRLLAELYYNDGKKVIHINQWMIENGYAVAYDGGKKIRPSEWDN